MGNKFAKVAAFAAVGGMACAWWGCGSGWWKKVLVDAGLSAAYEFLWDNDAVFDLFQDDFGTGTTYDDRFVAEPTRAEPEGAQAH